jgi:transcriptional regulator with XRE-family HTH domain
MAGPDPAILISAREAAGLDRRSAARKIGLNHARGVSGEERLAAMEAGESAPTAPVLRRMAVLYHCPQFIFDLRAAPSSHPASGGGDDIELEKREANRSCHLKFRSGCQKAPPCAQDYGRFHGFWLHERLQTANHRCMSHAMESGA